MAGERLTALSLWTVRRNDVRWSANLAFEADRVGWQVIIRRDGDQVRQRLFGLRAVALAWALSERDDLERGYLD
jgi:hypothetical protein